jgi:hypothetical protein
MINLRKIREKFKRGTIKKASRRLFDFQKATRCTKTKEPMQPGDSFRASSMGYLCVREEILAHRYDFIRVEHIQPGLQITFDIGHRFHDLYRDLYFGPMGEWAGAWECLHCGWSTDDSGDSAPPGKNPGRLATMPLTCKKCGAPFISFDDEIRTYGHFKEWLVEDHELFFYGHPDGWSVAASRVLADLKSNSATSFPTRRSVEPAHVAQLMAYLHMCQERHGSIWYVNKSPWGDSPSFLRDFEIEYNVDLFKKLVATPMTLLQNGLAGGPLPDRICPTKDCPRAKECQLSDVCFG